MAELYHVQDSDRPLWIIANDWADALRKWRRVIADENGDDTSNKQPQGIQRICDAGDLVITEGVE